MMKGKFDNSSQRVLANMGKNEILMMGHTIKSVKVKFKF